MPPRKPLSLNDPIGLLNNWPLLLGLGLYGAAFFLYAAALAHLPLNVVHPILTSGAIAVVAVLSIIIFREPFYWSSVTGIFMVIAGVVLITVRAP